MALPQGPCIRRADCCREVSTVGALVLAYLVGSISIARLATRASDIDITTVGSGNPGATNVARTLGKKAGAAVLVGDLLKGVIGSVIGLWLIPDGGIEAGFLGGAAAVVGHCLPLWFRFRGGKGVATAAGTLVVNVWVLSLVLTLVWAVLIKTVKISSVASMVVVVLAVPGVWIATQSTQATLVMAGIATLIIARHRDNIARLMAGREDTVV